MKAINVNQRYDTDRQRSVWMVAGRAGDSFAYNALLRSCIPLIKRVARREGVQSYSIDDVVQDTLLAVHQARHRYDPKQSFSGWLSTIARRRAIDGLRRIGSIGAREIYAPLAYENHPDVSADPGARTAELDHVARLSSALQRLPIPQQLTVDAVLRCRSFAGAAVVVGRRPGALRVSWHRALAALRGGMVGIDES